jgi:hypothetical protein
MTDPERVSPRSSERHLKVENPESLPSPIVVLDKARGLRDITTSLLQSAKEKLGMLPRTEHETSTDGSESQPVEGGERSLFGQLSERIRDRREQKRLETEYDQMIQEARTNGCEPVNFSPGMGINWRVSKERPLVTGTDERSVAIDCNVVVALGKEGMAMMHISPQTMGDQYINERTIDPSRRKGDRELSEMLTRIGAVDGIEVIAGDDNLAWAIEKYLTTGENAWGGEPSPNIDPSKLHVNRLGTGGKTVRADARSGKVMVCDHTHKRFYNISGSRE